MTGDNHSGRARAVLPRSKGAVRGGNADPDSTDLHLMRSRPGGKAKGTRQEAVRGALSGWWSFPNSFRGNTSSSPVHFPAG